MPSADLAALLSAPMFQPLPLSSIGSYLSSAPWHQIPGTFNYPPFVKERFIYRSGMLSLLPENENKEIVNFLGVKAIFDLRSKGEREADPEPELDGAESIWAENGGDEEVEWRTLVKMYFSFLTTHRAIFREIFLHVLRNPNQPFSVHCTDGKDRTAVAISLLLSLAGAPQEAITHDYVLTRIGVEPVRDILLAKMTGEGEVDWDSEVMKIVAIHPFEPLSLHISKRYLINDEKLEKSFKGGAEGYVVNELGFSVEEVEDIRQNLRNDLSALAAGVSNPIATGLSSTLSTLEDVAVGAGSIDFLIATELSLDAVAETVAWAAGSLKLSTLLVRFYNI
ncbi:hypothetical protein MferCBS31731_002652 [Microsporum ferrugineum]